MGLIEDALRKYLAKEGEIEISFVGRTFTGADILGEMEEGTGAGEDFKRRIVREAFTWIRKNPDELTVDDFLGKLAESMREGPNLSYVIMDGMETKTFTMKELADEVESRTEVGEDHAEMTFLSVIDLRVI